MENEIIETAGYTNKQDNSNTSPVGEHRPLHEIIQSLPADLSRLIEDTFLSREALKKSEEKYRILFESMDEGYCIIQLLYNQKGEAVDWRFIQVNPAFEMHNGLHNAEGKTILELTPNIERKWIDIYNRVAQTGEPIRFEEDSQALNRIFTLYAFRIGDPEERKVAVIFTDITGQRKAEKTLRINKERMHSQKEAFRSAVNGNSLESSLYILARMVAMETNDDARTDFYIVNDEGAGLHTVRGAGSMSFSYADEIDGLLIGEKFPPCGLAISKGEPVIKADVFEDTSWKPWLYLSEKYHFRGCWSFPIVTKDNKAIGTFAMYFDTPREATTEDLALAEIVTQTAAVIISNNIAMQQRTRAEIALRNSQLQLKNINAILEHQLLENKELIKQKDEFISMASHELRTPLTPLNIGLDLLIETYKSNGDEFLNNTLCTLSKQTKKLISLFNNLLEASNSDIHHISYNMQDFDIAQMIDETVSIMQTTTKHKLILQCAESCKVNGDKERLNQVFINLLANAIKYSPDAKEVQIKLSCSEDFVIIAVRDFGIGISGKNLKKIFERFYRVEDQQSKGFSGFGIGLYIAYEIVGHHKGDISVESEHGNGSTFYMRLPVLQVQKRD